jgi:hypothetical protein
MLGSFEVRTDDGVFADVPGARLRQLLIVVRLAHAEEIREVGICPFPRWPPGNELWRSLSGWSETDRERGSAIGVLYRGQVGAGRAGRREHDDPVGGAVGGTGYERGTLGVRGDELLWVALHASLMAECFADGAGDLEGRIGVSELVGASHVSEHAADGDFGLCRAGRSSCRR